VETVGTKIWALAQQKGISLSAKAGLMYVKDFPQVKPEEIEPHL